MFTAIIVDDEQTIREGLSKHIKRSFPEINIVNIFSDGKDAIDFLCDNCVDIVLTDIRMSEKSGIDVARHIYENSHDTKVIFLSAYQEFEYAKQAIQFGVKNYLSKPIKLSELNEVITDLLEEFRKEQKSRDSALKDNDDLKTLLSIVKRDFYSDIFLGILKTQDEIIKRAEKIRLSKDFLSNTGCAVFSVSLTLCEGCYYGSDELFNCITNLLREIKGLDSAILLSQNKHEAFFIGEFNTVTNLYESLVSDFNEIKINAKELLSVSAELKILFCGENIFSLTEYRNFENNIFSLSSLLEDKFKSLISGILSKDYQSAKNNLDDLRIYSQSFSINDSKTLMSNLFSKISSTISGDLQFPEDTFNDVGSRQELFEKGDEALNTIFEKVSASDDIENPTIIKAKEYITEHLSEDIGLEDIAGHIYLNPVYFSRFFKQHTGQTMTEYLTMVRINLASDMLKSHKYKIHEISSACGYKSSKYFAKIFKQYTGQTPSDYSKIN